MCHHRVRCSHTLWSGQRRRRTSPSTSLAGCKRRHRLPVPTLSFPVPGTLMIEPTESEPLPELDRFCDAMIAIRQEIRRVEAGDWPPLDNPLKAAPHTAQALLKTEWTHPYTREQAAYPLAAVRRDKYWVPPARGEDAPDQKRLVYRRTREPGGAREDCQK
eukprot:gene997-1403_t